MPGARWTEQDRLVLGLFYGTVPLSQIAKKLGRSEVAVYCEAERSGLRDPRVKSLTREIQTETEEALREDYLKQGPEQLAEFLTGTPEDERLGQWRT